MSFPSRTRLCLWILGLMLGPMVGASSAVPGDENWDSRFNQPIRSHGSVSKLAVAGSNVYVAGTFIEAGGLRATNVARWDGTKWSALGSGMSGRVDTLFAYGSNVYAGGAISLQGSNVFTFTYWDGTAWMGLSETNYIPAPLPPVPYKNGACWLAYKIMDVGVYELELIQLEGTQLTVITPLTNAYPRSLATFRGELYAASYAYSESNAPTHKLSRWDGTNWVGIEATITPWSTNSPAYFTIAADDQGLYAVGWFTSIAGVSATNAARWDGTNWSALGAGLDFSTNGGIYFATAHGDHLYVAGWFGPERPLRLNLGCWDGNQWTITPWNPWLFAAGEGGVYASRNGSGWDNKVYELSRWNGTNWFDLPGGVSDIGSVNTMVFHGRDVIVGGDFYTIGGISASNVAGWNGTNWHTLGSGADGRITTLYSTGEVLLAGGNFNAIGGIQATGLARWDGNQWSAMKEGQNFRPVCFGQHGTNLFAGGLTLPTNDISAGPGRPGEVVPGGAGTGGNGIWRWAGTNWEQVLGIAQGWSMLVRTLPVIDSRLYAVGSFNPYEGEGIFQLSPSTNLMTWEGTNWVPVPTGVPWIFDALASDNQVLYFGSWNYSYGFPPPPPLHQQTGATPTFPIGWFDGTNWHESRVAFSPQSGSIAEGGGLYLGNQTDSPGVVKWNGVYAEKLGSGIPGGVQVMLSRDKELFVGGRFSKAGGKSSEGFAIWHEPAIKPELHITQSTSFPSFQKQMLVSWPNALTNWILEECIELHSTNWSAGQQPVTVIGSQKVVTNLWPLLVRLPFPGYTNSSVRTNNYFRLREFQ